MKPRKGIRFLIAFLGIPITALVLARFLVGVFSGEAFFIRVLWGLGILIWAFIALKLADLPW